MKSTLKPQAVPVELDTLGKRLRWAMNRSDFRAGHQQRGLRLFQRRMPKMRGTTISSIQTYLADTVEPLPAFLRAAANVLGVREAWLMTGDGLPTADEDATTMDQGFASGARDLQGIGGVLMRSKVVDALRRAGFGFEDLPDVSRQSVLEGFDLYRGLAFRWGGKTGFERLARRYALYLSAPFTTLAIDPGVVDSTQRALVVDSLLRPLSIVRWALLSRVRDFPPPESSGHERGSPGRKKRRGLR